MTALGKFKCSRQNTSFLHPEPKQLKKANILPFFHQGVTLLPNESTPEPKSLLIPMLIRAVTSQYRGLTFLMCHIESAARSGTVTRNPKRSYFSSQQHPSPAEGQQCLQIEKVDGERFVRYRFRGLFSISHLSYLFVYPSFELSFIRPVYYVQRDVGVHKERGDQKSEREKDKQLAGFHGP
jgi:hypothetical protein